ncbi:MAG TPA: ATP-binding cassette domain-containing protein [Solirubrobacteraceae bacterium]|nr:ATP-binding cassette domain-containing protein [Solirubrobacteraceae bacterium]
MSALLAAQDVVVEYRVARGYLRGRRDQPIRALAGASVAVERGQALGIVGESGAGKTTLAKVLCGLLRAQKGTVSYNGVALEYPRARGLARTVQMVFQDPGSSLNPVLTARQVFAELLRFHGLAPGELIADRCRELVELVHLPERVLDRKPGALSGGERQRVAIARALAVEPMVLIADEAVSALDTAVQAAILNVLARLRSELGIALVLVSHDLAVIRAVCENVAVMHAGEIVEQGPVEQVFANPVHDYTRALLAAAPRLTRHHSPAQVSSDGH